MNLFVLDQEFNRIAVVDNYESMLWVDRYNEPGEFEIYSAVTQDLLQYPLINNYIQIAESEKVMIIEDLAIESDAESGNKIRITGRSLESLLDRRCITAVTNITGSLQNSIKSLLQSTIIAPTDGDRKISNFIFEDNLNAEIVDLTFENQYTGKSVLEIVQEMCKSKDIGFKIILNSSNQFVMSLYKGTDRSYDQNVLPYVVFKPSFDNVIESDYNEKSSDSKTFVYIHAQYNEGTTTKDVLRTTGSGTGILRREFYTDSSITKEDGMSVNAFYSKIDQEASNVLDDYKVKKTFSGKYETSSMFTYEKDFFLGDVCQVANEYGMESTSRVTEYMWSISSSGIEHYPTFTPIE